MNAIKRIKIIVEHKKMSIRSFERLIGVSINVIQAALKKDAGVKDDTLGKIINACPDINPVWLLTGKGAMLLEDDGEPAKNTLKAMEETKRQYAYNIEALEKLLEAKDEIIALQREKTQLLQHTKEDKLQLISDQNKKIIEYFEVWNIEKTIKEAKEKITEERKKTKEDR